jgi:hypothetical protein
LKNKVVKEEIGNDRNAAIAVIAVLKTWTDMFLNSRPLKEL